MALDNNDLTGMQKAAILLISVGPERAARILQSLNKEEIEQLTKEISKWKNVPSEVTSKVWQEFYQMSTARQYMAQGGQEYAREVLERALGDHKAVQIAEDLGQGSQPIGQGSQLNPFDLLDNVDPQQLLGFIRSEHPQTIALILAHLKSEQAATILSVLPEELRLEVVTRIVNIGQISPEALQEIGSALKRELSSVSREVELEKVGGTRAAAEILNRADRSTEKSILQSLEKKNVQLAEEVKKLMFVFEDIFQLDDRSLQRVLREVDTKDLSLALKGASKKLREKFFKNMSSRAVETIKEDMEFMGPVKVRNVEQVQQKIVEVIRRLEEAGEIIGRGGKEEEVIV